MCLYPRITQNPRYKKGSEHYGKFHDARVLKVAIGCGKCWECRRKKVREWKIRLQWEMDTNPIRGRGVTLTFANKFFEDHKGNEHDLTAYALNHFRKRWQKEFNESPRYWAINELGQDNTERLHIHAIMWTEKTSEQIEKIWKYGQIWVEPIKGIDYFLKYVNKVDTLHPEFFPKIFCSKGIGKDFEKSQTFKELKANKRQYLRLKNGTKVDIPIYYRNKLWSVEEREQIWCELLDKKTRYVKGEEIDISTPAGISKYWRALNAAQRETERIGYPKSPWNRERYQRSWEWGEKVGPPRAAIPISEGGREGTSNSPTHEWPNPQDYPTTTRRQTHTAVSGAASPIFREEKDRRDGTFDENYCDFIL